MSTFAKQAIKKAKLAVLWVRRILFAPDHFSTSPLTRLSLAVRGGIVFFKISLKRRCVRIV